MLLQFLAGLVDGLFSVVYKIAIAVLWGFGAAAGVFAFLRFASAL